jgi:hypothetical protein
MNDLAQALHEVLDGNAAALVAAYFNPASRFAGSTFDTLAPNPRNHFTASDLLAVTCSTSRSFPKPSGRSCKTTPPSSPNSSTLSRPDSTSGKHPRNNSHLAPLRGPSGTRSATWMESVPRVPAS